MGYRSRDACNLSFISNHGYAPSAFNPLYFLNGNHLPWHQALLIFASQEYDAASCILGFAFNRHRTGAYVYHYCLLSLKPIFSKITLIPRKYHSIIPLLLVIPVGLYNAHLLGGSHLLITSLFKHEFESSLSKGSMTFIWLAMILFLIRFIYSMLSYGTSVPGGTFMPISGIGSIIRGYLRQYFGSQQLLKQRLLPTHHYHFNGSLLRSNCQGSFNRGYFTDRNGRDRATGLANDFNNLHRLLHS